MKNVKIGDKVVLISEDHWSKSDYLKVGEIYTVDRLDDATIKVSEGRHNYYISKSQFKRVVTTVDVGAKVVRGKDWSWSDQDAGSCYGIITEKDSSTNWVAIDDLSMGKSEPWKDVWGLENFVLTPRASEGIKQSDIKDKVIKFLNVEIQDTKIN
jgi:hypothetical protein